MSQAIRLDISIVVFASPHESTLVLKHEGNHVVDKSVLVPETFLFEGFFIVLVIDLLEGVLELSVVGLQNSVFGRHVQRHLSVQGILEAGMGEAHNRFGSVIHTHGNASFSLVIVDLMGDWLSSVGWGESQSELSLALNLEVGGLVLVTEGVSANNNWLSPLGAESWNVVDDDWLSENGSSQKVSDGSVRRFPHLLQVELLDSCLIRGDGGALDTDSVLLDSLSGLKGDLVIGGVSVLHTKIKIFDLEIEVRKDQLVLDHLPDHSGHFVSIEFDDWVFDNNFALHDE